MHRVGMYEKMLSTEKKTAKRFAKKLQNLLGGNLVAVVAIGSRVRGDYTDASDLDILVIVKRRTFSLIDKINRVLAFDEEEAALPFSVSVSVKETGAFQKEKAFNTSFYRTIATGRGNPLWKRLESRDSVIPSQS